MVSSFGKVHMILCLCVSVYYSLFGGLACCLTFFQKHLSISLKQEKTSKVLSNLLY